MNYDLMKTSLDHLVFLPSGLDARGFLIGPMVAHECEKAFVPVRKAGKLPGKTISKTSTKEYGEVRIINHFLSLSSRLARVRKFRLIKSLIFRTQRLENAVRGWYGNNYFTSYSGP